MMRKMIALAVVAGFLFAGPAQAQEKKEKPRKYPLTAFAVNMGQRPERGIIDIMLERLSTAEERATSLRPSWRAARTSWQLLEPCRR